MTTPTPEDGCKAEKVSADQMEISRLRHELEGLTNAGVVECMARNRSVFERISDLERDLAAAQEAIRKQGQSALMGMDAAKAIASHNLESAKAINAQSNPAALDEARALNERLTNELEAAQEARQRAEARAEECRNELNRLKEGGGEMSKTPEGGVKAMIKHELAQLSIHAAGSAEWEIGASVSWYYMPVQNGMGVSGIPDFIGCHRGMFWAIEAKAPGKEPNTNQLRRHWEIRNSGGMVWVVDCEEDMQMVRDWIALMDRSWISG